jgi:hypothetical protein
MLQGGKDSLVPLFGQDDRENMTVFEGGLEGIPTRRNVLAAHSGIGYRGRVS